MTRHQDTGGGTLLEAPATDEVQVIPQEPAPTKTRARIVWLLTVLIVLALLGAWAVTQTRTADQPVDTPRVYSDHEADWWLHAQLREDRATQARGSQVDPRIQQRLREQDRAAQAQGAQLDPWVQRRVRDQDRSGQAVSGTGPALENYAKSSHDPVKTDRSTRHGERDDRHYLNQLGSPNASATPGPCRPAIRPAPC